MVDEDKTLTITNLHNIIIDRSSLPTLRLFPQPGIYWMPSHTRWMEIAQGVQWDCDPPGRARRFLRSITEERILRNIAARSVIVTNVMWIQWNAEKHRSIADEIPVWYRRICIANIALCSVVGLCMLWFCTIQCLTQIESLIPGNHWHGASLQ